MSLGAIGQSKFFKGAHNLTGRLQAGYGQATDRLLAGHGLYGQVMGRLQASYGPYRQVTGGLRAGYRQATDRQVMEFTGRLWEGYGQFKKRVMGRQQAGYRQVMDLMGRLWAGYG